MTSNDIFPLISKGKLDLLKAKLAEGADPHQTGKMGYNALHQAAKYGHPEIVSYLVEIGIDLESRSTRGETVLHIAATHKRIEVMERALQLGLDANVLDGYGFSALYEAVEHRHHNACRLLLTAGADVNLAVGEEKRPPLLPAITKNDLALVELLVEQGADVNGQDKGGATMLHWAAKYASVDIVRFLLDRGADPLARRGESVVHAMAQGNHIEGAKLILQRGATIDDPDENGQTPLMRAIWMGKVQFVEFLLAEGADLYVEDRRGRSAFAYAESSGRSDIVDLLRAEAKRRGGPPRGAPVPKTGRDLVLRYLDQQVAQKTKKIVLHLDSIAENLEAIPPEVGDYPAIVEIDANNSNITTFPPSIGKLENLKRLSAINTPLRSLPEEFGQLHNLESFIAWAAKLEALPESIGQLKKLRVLEVSGNLRALPETIGGCTSLKKLSLGGNRLRDLPVSCSRLQSLTELNLVRNELQAVPEPIFGLSNLRTLKLSDNNVTAIPDRFLELTSLKKIMLSDNPALSSPPYAIAKQGVEAIREYIVARQETSQPHPEAPEDPLADGVRQSGHLAQLEVHIHKYAGPIHRVWHELVSDDVHIDIFWVKATKRRPFHVLVTSGLSAQSMQVPDDAQEYQLAELLLCLPKNWPLEQEALEDETAYWPIRLLKEIVRYVHGHGTWIAVGHTLEREAPDPGTPAATLVWWPLRFDPRLRALPLPDGRSVNFYSVIPLKRSELALKLEQGVDALLERLESARVSELVDPDRLD